MIFQFGTNTWDWSFTDLTQWEQNCVGNLTQSCALSPLNKLMSLHGTVQLCASNKLSFQSRPFSAQKISLSVEQSSFTAICLPLWMIIRAELAWWPLPCVWLYQEDKFMLWKSLESALQSVYAHPSSQTMRNPLSATSSPWGEPKTYGGCFPHTEILRR